MLIFTFHLFPQKPVPIGRIEDISLIVIPIPEAPSTSDEIDFEEYYSFRAEVCEIPYTKSDLASYDLSSANYRKGFSIFFKSVDGTYNFSNWPTDAKVRVFYVINCTNAMMKLFESDIESALKQVSIIEINLSLPSVRSSLRRGRLDIEDKKFSRLKTGDFITLIFLIENKKKYYTAISHLQGINFHWAFPSILKTNLSKLFAGVSTPFFEATPIATIALGGIYNISSKDGIGLVGVASADVLWMLSRVGEQIQGADVRNLVESLLLGGAVLWRHKGNFLYVGAGASWIFNQDTQTFSPQLNVIAGASIFELLSKILSPLER
jgi:hypothetical protein